MQIVSLYKYYLASAIDRKKFIDILFEASKDFTQYRFNVIYGENDVEHYGFSRDFYKELLEKFSDYDWIDRPGDLNTSPMVSCVILGKSPTFSEHLLSSISAIFNCFVLLFLD